MTNAVIDVAITWKRVKMWHVELDPHAYQEEIYVLMCGKKPMLIGRIDDLNYFNSLCEDLNKGADE